MLFLEMGANPYTFIYVIYKIILTFRNIDVIGNKEQELKIMFIMKETQDYS
jgi:hypothetical protein